MSLALQVDLLPLSHQGSPKSLVVTKLDSILKSRDITLSIKVHLVKAMFFQWSCIYVRVDYKES